MAHIEQFKANAKELPESQAASADSEIVFQLNYRPEQARHQQTARVAELEGRIRRLETVLGASDEKMARLAAATSKGKVVTSALHKY